MHFIQKSGPVGTDWLRPAAKGPLKPKMLGHQNQLSALQCHEWVKINHLEPLPSNNWKSCQSLHPLTIILLCQLCLLSCALSAINVFYSPHCVIYHPKNIIHKNIQKWRIGMYWPHQRNFSSLNQPVALHPGFSLRMWSSEPCRSPKRCTMDNSTSTAMTSIASTVPPYLRALDPQSRQDPNVASLKMED